MKPPDPTFNVFVYGTLMRGGRLHEIVRDYADFVGPTRTAAPNYDLVSIDGMYPGAVATGRHHIEGELYRCESDVLWYLDYVEHEGTLYNRTVVPLANGVSAFLYLINRTHATRFAQDKRGILYFKQGHEPCVRWVGVAADAA